MSPNPYRSFDAEPKTELEMYEQKIAHIKKQIEQKKEELAAVQSDTRFTDGTFPVAAQMRMIETVQSEIAALDQEMLAVTGEHQNDDGIDWQDPDTMTERKITDIYDDPANTALRDRRGL